jgi:hypothetical protein
VLPSLALAAPPSSSASSDTSHAAWHDSLYSWEYVRHHARPALAIHYGMGDVQRHGFGGDLAPVGAFDVHLGYRVEQRIAGEDALFRRGNHFGYIGNNASRLRSDTPSVSEIGTDMWRFGVGDGDGYGYRFASERGRLVLDNTDTFGWYTLDVEGEAVANLSASDAQMLEQFTSHTRFGESWDAGIEVGMGEMVALRAGYERSAVFPSFKIWYWLLSSLIDQAALMAVDIFADRVEETSPFASPILRFVLVGAVQYGFYELRTEEVNWPFDTEPPLDYEMFKLGVTARF